MGSVRLALVLLILLAGCSQPAAQVPPEPTGPSVEPVATTSPRPDPIPSAPEPAGVDGFVRDGQGAVAGADVRVVGTELAATSAADGSFGWSEVPPGQHTILAVHGQRNGSVVVDLPAGSSATVFIDLGVDAVAPVVPPPAPGFACPDGQVQEPHATHGRGDAQVDDLTWAVLKTGFRFAAAWSTPTEAEATLAYTIDGGAIQTTSSLGTTHLVVLDDLPVGSTLCFRIDDGRQSDWHAVRLGNAMNALDGVYTANFLVLANERTSKLLLEQGVAGFARLLWDATDGHVRVGHVIVFFDHYDRQQEAFQPCWNANVGVHAGLFTSLPCERWFDVIFSHNMNPAAAGGTYSDGIQQPDVPVWMNALHEGGVLSGVYTQASQVKEIASVLTHEVGHYMFGAQDLYPEAGIVSSNCYQPATRISIMSSSRDATEFDSASTPCGSASSGYIPTWTLMRDRFPAIAERQGPPVPGPMGDGGAFGYAAFTVGA